MDKHELPRPPKSRGVPHLPCSAMGLLQRLEQSVFIFQICIAHSRNYEATEPRSPLQIKTLPLLKPKMPHRHQPSSPTLVKTRGYLLPCILPPVRWGWPGRGTGRPPPSLHRCRGLVLPHPLLRLCQILLSTWGVFSWLGRGGLTTLRE